MKEIIPHFIAEITLYPSEKGGPRAPLRGERIGFPAKFHEKDYTGWDCFILLRGDQIAPGETKRFGVVFLSSEIVPAFRSMDKFFLCTTHAVGAARAV